MELKTFLSVEIWAAAGHEFNATCYLWLTDDDGSGDAPEKHSLQEEQEALLAALV